MTAITALITKTWIASASDSLLTEVNPQTNTIKHIEFKKSKIVPIKKFKAAASYWGLAKVGNWRTYDFLVKIATQEKEYDSFENFASYLKDELNKKLNSFTFSNPLHKGIGIHLVGYENINKQEIPELFLITNFTDETYTKVEEFKVKRNLYKTLPEEYITVDDNIGNQRKQILKFLDNGGMFIFNNGDPALFNPVAKAINEMFKVAWSRNDLQEGTRKYAKLAVAPIEVIKTIQKNFFKKDSIRIGGKTHYLLTTRLGEYISR